MGAEQQAALPGHGSGLAGDTSPHLLHVRCLSRLPKQCCRAPGRVEVFLLQSNPSCVGSSLDYVRHPPAGFRF
jgi:hypothetical protein